MRKKILAILFAALLTLALAVPAFAQDDQGENEEPGEQANAEQGAQSDE